MNSKRHLISIFSITMLLLAGCTNIFVAALNQVTLTKVAVENDKIYLMGDFNSQSYDQVKQIIDNNTNVKTIVLTANSGSLDDEVTFKLARYIRTKELNTHLLSQSVIASGAVDLFLAGINRTIETGAQLGVHSWSDGSKQANDFPRDHPDHDFNADYIKDMIGTDEFYWFTIYAAPADSIYWMKENEIEKYKLLTEPFLSASNDKSPFGQEFSNLREEILQD